MSGKGFSLPTLHHHRSPVFLLCQDCAPTTWRVLHATQSRKESASDVDDRVEPGAHALIGVDGKYQGYLVRGTYLHPIIRRTICRAFVSRLSLPPSLGLTWNTHGIILF